MTAYEIISIFIGILALLMSFGSLIVALLAFLDKRNKRKSEPPAEPVVCSRPIRARFRRLSLKTR